MSLESIFSQEIVQKLGWTLLHFVWQAAAIASLVAILLAGLRKAAASLRYIIVCLALGLMILLPIVTMSLVPVSPPQRILNVEPLHGPVTVPLQQTTREIPVAGAAEYEGPAQLKSADITPRPAWKRRAVEQLEPALPYLVTGWLFGVFGLSLWHLGGWAQLQRLRRKLTRPVDVALCAAMRQLADKLGVDRVVELLESALVQVPTVVGWLRPVILLPAVALTGLSAEQLEALLAHELAHVRRYDYLVNMLQTVVETLGFYHPAVWWVSHKIRVERENCSDDLAVGITGDRVSYARALTSMEEIRAGRSELAVAASGGNLLARIRRLIAVDSPENRHLSWIPSVIAIVLIAALALPATLALSRQSSNTSHEIKSSLLETLDQTGANMKGQQILKQVAELNRYWLLGPSSKVRQYSYDFHRYDSEGQSIGSETIKIRNAASTKPAYRQGITYDSVIHKLLTDPSAAVIHEIQENERTIRLDFVFKEFTQINCGNGIHHQWGGYFSSPAKSGSVWLDAETKVPVKVEAGPIKEYFSDFVAAGDGRYVPLRVEIANGVIHFDWRFGLYEPGLWLFDASRNGQTENGLPRVVTSISNVKVNTQPAVKTAAPMVGVVTIQKSNEKDETQDDRPARLVNLVLDKETIECEGKAVTWDTLAPVLAKIPDRWSGGLQLTTASDKLDPETLSNTNIRASVLARELGFGYLSHIGKHPRESNDLPGPYFFAGPLEFGEDVPIGLRAGADFRQDRYVTQGQWVMDETGQHKEWSTIWIGSVRLSKTWIGNHVDATVKVSYPSWPEARWRIAVRLLDDGGNSLAEASDRLDTGGHIISGHVLTSSNDLSLSLGQCDVSKAAAFEMTVSPLSENESTSQPSAHFILDKMLEHRSRVKNLQYIAENQIWHATDPTDDLIKKLENDVKKRKEEGVSERDIGFTERTIEQLRTRAGRSEGPQIDYEVLKCTIDGEGRSKIERTSGTYDSSGKEVPHGETHVWAWNGSNETELADGATIRDKPNISVTLGHPWRSFTGIFCRFFEETLEAGIPVSVEELNDGACRVGFDYKTSRYVATVDPSKGYTCALQETYNKQGQRISRSTAEYKQVAEDIWFPVSGQSEIYAADRSIQRKYTYTSTQIKVNDPAFNTSYFDVNIPKGTIVRDEVHGKRYILGSKRMYDLNERLDSSAETQEPDPNTWQEKFYSLYRLEDGEVLKRIALPFIPERREYFKLAQPGRYSANTPYNLAKQFIFSWDGALNIRNMPMGGGIPRLNTTLESVIGLGRNEYDIAPEFLNMDMSGDWIIRKDTPQEELLLALEPIIKEETGKDIHFVKQKAEAKVIIARGIYRLTPLPDAKEKDCVHVFTDKLDTYQGAGGGRGTLSRFLRFVGDHRINMTIIDRTESGDVELSWRNHYSSDFSWLKDNKQTYDERVNMLLNNLARQMGLTFERGTATIEKWFISENGTIKAPPKAAADVEDVKAGARADMPAANDMELGISKPSEGISMPPADAAVYEQLETTIVDLSALKPTTSFNEALDVISHSVDPPLDIKVIWKDLQDRAGINGDTKIGMEGASAVLLGTGLENMLKAVASGSVELNYIVDNGAIKIATLATLPPKLLPRVYDISDLVTTTAGADALIRRLTETIEPESWHRPGRRGGGTILAYPVQEPKKLAILQSRKTHMTIEDMLDELEHETQSEGGPGAAADEGRVERLAVPKTDAKESAERLMGIGRAMRAYAKDHDGKYPQGAKPYELREYLNTEKYGQYEYMADGKTTRDPADTVLYYDVQLFEQGKGTNVLFNDGHVEFVGPERLDELNINKTQILIETRILEVTDDFLKENRLDANSVLTGEIRSAYPIAESATEPNSLPYCLIFDDLDVDLLLKAMGTLQGQQTKMLAAPQAHALDGRPVTMKMITELPLPGPSDPNDPSGKAESKLEYAEVGTFIKITPDALPDSNNVLLDFEWELSQVRGFEKQVGPDGKKQNFPLIARDGIKTTATVPDGKTLLIGGKKIRRWVVTRTKKPLLGDLPLVGSLFRSESRLEETRNVLMLIKPTVIAAAEG